MLIATLAEKFGLTSFKNFQKRIIDATLEGRDTLVVHPTGSGKSLCFQFPPVFQDKKAVVITPTISLMQYQVCNLRQKGIRCTYLGSAQLDKEAESNSLDLNSDISVIFVTPEWIAKLDKLTKVQALASAGKLSLIAIDEAHLVSEWADFRKAYRDLESLHSSFHNTPIMALTATATPEVETEIKKLIRNPVVTKASINRPNISLSAKEVKVPPGGDYFHTLADHVADISCSEPTIVYTDFIADIGPIVSSLADLGIKAVGYYGEVDPRERQESYTQWKSGQVKVMVSTKAFGMGIDKDNIRHVIRNGVPESLVSWAQEFGRAGRDGQHSTATILYRKSDIRHADPWVWNNVRDHKKCHRILTDFSNSWRYVEARLAGCCRRKILIDLFGETDQPTFDFICCDVCSNSSGEEKQVFNDELKILIDALNQVGAKGEVKVAEWIRGSSVLWTNAYNKKALSYGNSQGHTLEQWRLFMRQCHVLGLIRYELRSMIKGNGHYSVMGVYSPLEASQKYIDTDETLLLPGDVLSSTASPNISTQPTSSSSVGGCSSQDTSKRKRMGKGSNILTTIRNMLTDKENWKSVSNKCDYHFLGAFSEQTEQNLYYIPDCTALHQAAESNHHYLWNDIQLSKGQGNKDRLIEAEIGVTKEKVFYRSASCLGVKSCPEKGCDYVAPIREKRGCKNHTHQKLVRSSGCPVEFVYIYPEKYETDHRRWIGGIIRNQKAPLRNLHNHKLHGAFKICTLVQNKICDAVQSNPTLTATDVSRGKGIGFIPSAVDSASSHLGRIAREVSKTKSAIGITNSEWSPCSFEQVANDIDKEDNTVCHDKQQEQQYNKYGRPYLVSAGVENGIKYACAMSPLMSQVLAEAEFLQTDITYNQSAQYPYLFNAAVFNEVTMEWMVVARVWLDNQSQQGYKLAFKKMFDTCREGHPDFELGNSLQAIVLDWSDAEINGLKEAIGDKLATTLVKGCKVHWMRSCQKVADKVASPQNKEQEKRVFLRIARKIQTLSSAIESIACFEALCGVRTVTQLLEKLPNICTLQEAKEVDASKDWSSARNWAQWWTRSTHLKMLSAAFTDMETHVWHQSPTTTNAVERKNRDCKTDAVLVSFI